MTKLYRGVDLKVYREAEGIIYPKGTIVEKNAKFGKAVFGRNTFGPSKINTVVDHQTDSDTDKSCYVSTSRSFDKACYFATTDNMSIGVVYVLDTDMFEQYGVEMITIKNSEYDEEQETTIKAKNGGHIPHQVILGAMMVEPN